jgi:hypothetical protein
MGHLPTFIVIGAMKCGTSSLYAYLREHPQVEMSTIKEPDFFIEEHNFGRGIDWYRSLWPEGGEARGEASSSYTKRHGFGGVPARMHSIIPDARLVYVVRDPFDRIVSHYVHNRAAGRENETFEVAVGKRPMRNNYVQTTAYAGQLEEYLPYFPMDQILVVDANELMHRRMPTLRGVFRHIGVRARVSSPVFARTSHRSVDKRIGDDSIERPEWSDELADRIREVLQPEVDRLRELTAKPFDSWAF